MPRKTISEKIHSQSLCTSYSNIRSIVFQISTVLNRLLQLDYENHHIFFALMHFVKIFIKDRWKFSSFRDNIAIPNQKIALILGLLMYFLELLP